MSLSGSNSFLNDYFRNGESQVRGLPSVRYFADKVFLSPGYFGDLVKKETGKTAQEYIQGKIIELSKEYILGSQLGISQIAYSFGISISPTFQSFVQKLEGCTPNEFRNQAMS